MGFSFKETRIFQFFIDTIDHLQISSRCRKNTGYEGDINISHCYWLAYTRDRLCCYYRIPGSPREWYHAVDDCYEHCRSSKCRYCLDPPSRYQTTTPAPPPSCFPSAARVNLQTGETVTMSELQIGDRVQTGELNFTHLNTFTNSRM